MGNFGPKIRYVVSDKAGSSWGFATASEVAIFMLGKSNLTWSIWKRVDAGKLSANVTILERQIEAMEPGKGDKPCQSDTRSR